MTDLVERLRVYIPLGQPPDNTVLIYVAVLAEAADEIERLRAKVNELDGMWRAADKGGQAEIEKLRDALRRLTDIADNAAMNHNIGDMDAAIEQARAALERPA